MQHWKKKTHNAQAWLKSFSPVIKSATFEFHKAQCYFMLAIDIAALLKIKNASLNAGSVTL